MIKWIFLLGFALLISAEKLLFCNQKQQTFIVQNQPDFDRKINLIYYSKHARCRMACRSVTEEEVKQIISNGVINYRKSNLQKATCFKRFAIEGKTADNQQLRIIVAPCETKLTVITVIDLTHEWACNCY